MRKQAGYAGLLTTWLTAIGQWDDIPTTVPDWPIVNLEEYIRFVQRMVPEPALGEGVLPERQLYLRIGAVKQNGSPKKFFFGTDDFMDGRRRPGRHCEDK